jgi:hypothetical protein
VSKLKVFWRIYLVAPVIGLYLLIFVSTTSAILYLVGLGFVGAGASLIDLWRNRERP